MDQSTLDTLSYLPLAMFVIFGGFCWVGSWRRVIVSLVFVFSAVIIALQYNAFVTNVIFSQMSGASMSYVELSALVFAVMIAGGFIGLYVLFVVVWRPKPADERKPANFGANLLRGMLGGIAGIVLGIMVLVGILGYMLPGNPHPIRSLGSGAYAGIVTEVAEQTINFADPWVPGELPRWVER